MSRIIIDPEYLGRISTELENDKSSLSTAQEYISTGIKLDQKVINKIGATRINEIVYSINKLIRSNENIIASVNTAKEEFKALSDYKSSVKIEEFISISSLVQPTNDFENLSIEERIKFVDDMIKPFENELSSMNAEYSNKYSNGIPFSEKDFELIYSYLLSLNIFDMVYASPHYIYENPVLHGSNLNIENLGILIDFCNENKVFEMIEKYNRGASWKDSGLENFYSSSNNPRYEGFSEQEFILNYEQYSDTSLLETRNNEKYNFLIASNNLIESYNTQQTMSSDLNSLSTQVYNMKILAKLLPFEYVTENEDFKPYLEKNYENYDKIDRQKLELLESREVAIYAYLIDKGKEIDANLYLLALTDSMNRRQGMKEAIEFIINMSNNGGDIGDVFISQWEGIQDGVENHI